MSADLSQILRRLDSIEQHHTKIHEDLSEQMELMKVQLEPVSKLYRDMEGSIRVVKWIFGALVAIGGAFLLIKSIFSKPL